jgi:Tfp pilus assembly protein PilF
MTTKDNTRQTIISFLIPVAYAAWGFIIYSSALNGPFYLDDGDNIRNNPALRDLGSFLDFSGTRYVTYLSFALNYSAHGLSAYAYRLTNLAIHVLNAILVYRLVLLIGQTPLMRERAGGAAGDIAIASSLFFLVHPLQTQAVSYITQRFASLATLFFLLSVVLYIGARLKQNGPAAYLKYGLAVLSAVVAMKTKEISFTLPFVLCFFEFVFFKGDGVKARLLYIAPFLVTLVVVPLSLYGPLAATGIGQETVQSLLRKSQMTDLAVMPRYNYFISQFYVILVYIKLFLAPVGLHLNYDFKPAAGIDFRVAVSFIALLAIFIASILLFLRSLVGGRTLGIIAGAGLVWFFMTLSVESSVIPIQHVIFEHRTYLPGVGFFVFLGACVVWVTGRVRARLCPALGERMAFGVVVLVVAAVLSVITYSRNAEWGDPIKFRLSEIRSNPRVAGHYNDLGFAYMEAGRDVEAIEALKKALELEPDFAAALSTLSAIYMNQGHFVEAEPLLLHAVDVEPGYVDAHYNLATVYLNTGRFAEAIALYEKVLAALYAEPLQDRMFTSDTHVNLANAYMATGEYNLAVNEYENALRMNPDNQPARRNLNRALKFPGR